MNVIEKLEREEIEKLAASKDVPDFSAGDTIKVMIKVVEGGRERLQPFEGVCIAKNGGGINESFTLRKISYGEGVERVFPVYAPSVARIEVVRRGKVRRAKLYYLRGRRGKSARIAEKQDWRVRGAQQKARADAVREAEAAVATAAEAEEAQLAVEEAQKSAKETKSKETKSE